MFASALASRALASLALLCGAHAFLSAPAAGRVGSRLGACTHGRREWVVVCGARRRGGAAATAAPRACAGAGGMEGLRVFGMDDVSLDRYVGQVTYTESVSVGQGPSLTEEGALRAGDLTATVGTATVRSFQASLTDISVRTRGSLCVCVRERERERERERVVVRVCVCTYVFATHPQKDSE